MRRLRLYEYALASAVALTGCAKILDIEDARPGWSDTGTGATATGSTGTTSGTCGSTGNDAGSKANGATCAMGCECASGFCIGDGAGSKICCQTGCPGNFACAPGGTCHTMCSSNADCAASYGCNAAGACLLLDGQVCTMQGECISNFCADGVCCNSACNTACHACTAALTGGMNGACAPVTDGTDEPHGLCPMTPKPACGTDGKCVAGACEEWPSTTVCGVECGSAQPGWEVVTLCSGGACTNTSPQVMCHLGCAGPILGCMCTSNADCPPLTPTCVNGACAQ